MKYRLLKGYKYALMACIKYETAIKGEIDTKYISLHRGDLTIFKHYAWDGPSGPAMDTKNFMKASLVHDALYQLIREGLLVRTYRHEADLLLKKICLEEGMSKFRAWYAYKFVSMFCEKASLPRKKPRGRIVEI